MEEMGMNKTRVDKKGSYRKRPREMETEDFEIGRLLGS